MKYVDIEDMDNVRGKRLEEDETFMFRCHSGLSCFNRCCHNLNLFLYPYDVLRLKDRLGISSDRFLDEYVDVVLRPSNFFPDVLLRMSEAEGKPCPFLTEEGCAVYEDRPDTCRAFPLEYGSLYDAKTKKTQIVCFFRPFDFCQGQFEQRPITPMEWIADQEAKTYNKMTARWAEIKSMFQSDPWGGEGPEGQKGKMSFMAAYNIDRFRDFVFNSSFLKRYKIKPDKLKKMKKDDARLLRLGFDWIKFYVWGVQSKSFRLRK